MKSEGSATLRLDDTGRGSTENLMVSHVRDPLRLFEKEGNQEARLVSVCRRRSSVDEVGGRRRSEPVACLSCSVPEGVGEPNRDHRERPLERFP